MWGAHEAAAQPDTAHREQEDAHLDQPQDQTSLREPVILIDLSHKERIHEDHWSTLRERLREEGRIAIRTRQPVNPALLRSKKMLLIGAPEHRWVVGRGADRWQDEEVRAIERFVARGNALWVMGDGLCDAEALSEVTAPYGIRFCADPVGAVTVSDRDVCRHQLTRNVDEIGLGAVRGVGGNYLQVEEPAIVLAEHNGRAVMAYCEHKNGRVLVLSSLSAFSQRHVDDQDNGILLDNILHHLLHFAPPEQAQTPPESSDAEVKESAEERPSGQIDRWRNRGQSSGMSRPSVTAEAPSREAATRTTYGVDTVGAEDERNDELRVEERGAPPVDESGVRASEEDDPYLTIPAPDEGTESEDWDDAYH
jgi:hypothetical protein